MALKLENLLNKTVKYLRTLVCTGLVSITLAASIDKINAAELYVGNNPGDFNSIQSAIDESSEGDKVFVRKGTYNESIVMPIKSIELIGESWTNTLIDGTGLSPMWAGIYQEYPSKISIRGFTVQNFTSQVGGMLLSHNGGNVELSMCNIVNNSGGVFFGGQAGGTYNVHDNVINFNNSLDQRFVGLSFWFGTGEIKRNNISNNNQGGFREYYYSTSTISNNIIYGNNGPGIEIDTLCNIEISNNLIVNNLQGINSSMSELRLRKNGIIDNNSAGLRAWDWWANPSKIQGSENIITNNGNYNIKNEGVTDLNLTSNWWGSSPPDTSKISGSTTYEPYLNSAFDIFPPIWVGNVGIKSLKESSEGILLSWDPAIDQEGSKVIYDVYRRTIWEDYDWNKPYWSGDSISLLDSNINGNNYWYNVRARDEFGNLDININETTVPEPSTFSLLAIGGLAGLGVYALSRRKENGN